MSNNASLHTEQTNSHAGSYIYLLFIFWSVSHIVWVCLNVVNIYRQRYLFKIICHIDNGRFVYKTHKTHLYLSHLYLYLYI